MMVYVRLMCTLIGQMVGCQSVFLGTVGGERNLYLTVYPSTLRPNWRDGRIIFIEYIIYTVLYIKMTLVALSFKQLTTS